MVLVDGHGLPIALSLHEAAKHEVTLAFDLSQKVLTKNPPKRIIGDKAYDSDPLDAELAAVGIEMIASHRKNRKKKRTQDVRKLRRQKRRWCVERYFAWLHNFRRLPIRYERKSKNYFAFVLLATVIIYIRYLF